VPEQLLALTGASTRAAFRYEEVKVFLLDHAEATPQPPA
jgi:hypothetical protein